MTSRPLSEVLANWLNNDHGTTWRHEEGHDRVCDVTTVRRLHEPPDLWIGDEAAFLDFADAEPHDALVGLLEQCELDIEPTDLISEFQEILENYR